jgi:hypothetical protein
MTSPNGALEEARLFESVGDFRVAEQLYSNSSCWQAASLNIAL